MPKYPSDLWNEAEDSSGFKSVTLGTNLAGEDISNDLTKTEQRYSFYALTSLVTGTIKTGVGVLHSITFGQVSCPTIAFYDNIVPSGTRIIKFGSGTPVNTYTFNINFTTGLTVDATAAGVVPDISISYR